MKLYAVTIQVTAYVGAASREEAERVASDHLDDIMSNDPVDVDAALVAPDAELAADVLTSYAYLADDKDEMTVADVLQIAKAVAEVEANEKERSDRNKKLPFAG